MNKSHKLCDKHLNTVSTLGQNNLEARVAAARKRDMNRDTIIRIWQQSTARGGSFDKALGEAIITADDNNLSKLYNAFPHMWALYGGKQ